MYLIVMVMIVTGGFKITSNQILYPTMEMCEADRRLLVDDLMRTKPEEDAAVFSKCTDLDFEKDKAKDVKGI